MECSLWWVCVCVCGGVCVFSHDGKADLASVRTATHDAVNALQFAQVHVCLVLGRRNIILYINAEVVMQKDGRQNRKVKSGSQPNWCSQSQNWWKFRRHPECSNSQTFVVHSGARAMLGYRLQISPHAWRLQSSAIDL